MNFLSECTSGGCGAKIGPGELSKFLDVLPKFKDENLIIGFDSSDDAAVYKISEEQAIVSTVDFFSPMVEDPYIFGKIAAANALSDVYAMGGKVLFALNLVCFPQRMDKSILSQILKGGAEKVLEAGAIISGGHSIYDHEPKYGLSVTGTVHPKSILRNNTCKDGDCLILTKALGVGLIMSALRVGKVDKIAEDAALESMQRLNKYASEKLSSYNISACTDITGFGLLLHANEMAGTKKSLVIDTEQLPILPKAFEYAKEHFATSAGQRNRNFFDNKIDLSNFEPAIQEILFDPQTSGGLLISVPATEAEALLKDIQKDDPVASIIGQVVPREKETIILV